MMGTADAIGSAFRYSIRSGFRHYADFRGRVSRPAYQQWILFRILIFILIFGVVYVLRKAVGSGDSDRGLLQSVFVITTVALSLPDLAVTVRRLHDTDRSGWWVLLACVPVIGYLVLVVLLRQPGTPGANRYGSPPLH